MRRYCLAAAVVSLAGVVAAPLTAPAQSPDYSVQLRGIEISPGVIFRDVRYGTSFIGPVAGDLQGTWAVSFRYTPPHPGVGVLNEILGGTWNVSVCRAGRVVGTLFGTVQEGEAEWNDLPTEPEEATVWAHLNVVGGSGEFRRARGTADFSSGILSHEYVIPRIWGDLDIYLDP